MYFTNHTTHKNRCNYVYLMYPQILNNGYIMPDHKLLSITKLDKKNNNKLLSQTQKKDKQTLLSQTQFCEKKRRQTNLLLEDESHNKIIFKHQSVHSCTFMLFATIPIVSSQRIKHLFSIYEKIE